MDGEIYIEYMPLSELRGAPFNPKEHDLEAIEASFGRFGYTNPIICNEADGTILAGHGRVQELRILKASGKSAPDRIRVTKDDWFAPVVRGIELLHRDDAEAYVIGDNQITIAKGFHSATLNEMLARLEDKGKLLGTGFDTKSAMSELAERLAKKDEPEEEKAVAQKEEDTDFGVALGQIWEIPSKSVKGSHFILVDDCKKLNKSFSQPFDGIFTSPPYAEQRKKTYGGIPAENYVDWFKDIQLVLGKVLKEDGSFFLNLKPHVDEGERSLYVFKLVIEMAETWGWKFIEEYCWYKMQAVPGTFTRRLKNAFEPVYHFANSLDIKFNPKNFLLNPSEYTNKLIAKLGTLKDARQMTNKSGFTSNQQGQLESIIDHGGVLSSNVILAMPDTRSRNHDHSATYPVELVTPFLQIFSDEGDLWLDPFLGSGTTIVAAESVGRCCYGVELEPKNVNDALNRLSRLGLEVKKIGD